MDDLTRNVAALAASFLAGFVARELSSRRALAKARRQLKETRVELGEQQQLAAVGQVMSGLAQELKGPLQGVLGSTELMLASGPTPSGAEELEQIRENASRAAGIVRHLTAFTETSSLERRWHDCNVIAAHAVDLYQAERRGSGAHIRFAPAERLPLVYVDGRQLRRVMVTLLKRAQPSADVSLVTRRVIAPDDRLVIEIDDGSADASDDGNLWAGDLAACRRVVEAHGGSLEVQSSTEGGYRFHLELPISADMPTLPARGDGGHGGA